MAVLHRPPAGAASGIRGRRGPADASGERSAGPGSGVVSSRRSSVRLARLGSNQLGGMSGVRGRAAGLVHLGADTLEVVLGLLVASAPTP